MAKIYISSTFNDLVDYRKAAYDILCSMDHSVKAMEHYVATDQRPLDKCLADVEACDVYVGIFAWRYGFVPDPDDPFGGPDAEMELPHFPLANPNTNVAQGVHKAIEELDRRKAKRIHERAKIPLTIFVSYRRQDSGDVTGRIYDRLVQHFGSEAIFKDVDTIPLGVDFRKFLSDAVGRCNLLLAVIGRQWLNNQDESGARRLDNPRDFVRVEIEAALQRDIPVIPLLVQGSTVPNENDLPQSLRDLVYRHAISIRPDPDFHRDVDRLIKGIELHLKNSS